MARQKGIGEMSDVEETPNVVSISGNIPKARRVSDMKPGDVGYVTTWAYSEETNYLCVDAFIDDKGGGTACVRVECVGPGQYALRFEEPKYRRPRFRLW